MYFLGFSAFDFLQAAAVLLGLSVGILVWVVPRLGPGSGWLGIYAVISTTAVGVLAYYGFL